MCGRPGTRGNTKRQRDRHEDNKETDPTGRGVEVYGFRMGNKCLVDPRKRRNFGKNYEGQIKEGRDLGVSNVNKRVKSTIIVEDRTDYQ